MDRLPDIDTDYLTTALVSLLEIPSPTGMTEAVVRRAESFLKEAGVVTWRSGKGSLLARLDGENEQNARALTAHLDTLGAMVREIKPGGRLKLTRIGGYSWTAAEGEGCSIHTSSGAVYRGSILLTRASTHVHAAKVDETKREDDTIEVRIDARTTSVEETRALGIEVGDYVSVDTRLEISDAGFVRSRYLDDKAGAACMLAAVQALRKAGLRPSHATFLHFSTHEEVGHGAAGQIPAEATELVAVDMAAVGDGQNSDEFHVTVCAKDSGGPYDRDLTIRLQGLAKSLGLPFRMDTYPFYGSDAEAFARGGGDVRIALIGPGVDASHSYERTHLDALAATTRLILAYLLA